MHAAPAFHDTDPQRLAERLAAYPFALIIAVDAGRPLVAHAPVLFDAGVLRFHLSRKNPVTAALRTSGRALVVATGPDAYVSPDWYDTADQVPTWNYVSVEVEGAVKPLDDDRTATLLDDLSARFESELAPKPPWTRARMSDGRFDAMLGAIQGFSLSADRIEGVRKLNQNKSAAAQAGVVDALRARGGTSNRAIADLMNDIAESAQ